MNSATAPAHSAETLAAMRAYIYRRGLNEKRFPTVAKTLALIEANYRGGVAAFPPAEPAPAASVVGPLYPSAKQPGLNFFVQRFEFRGRVSFTPCGQVDGFPLFSAAQDLQDLPNEADARDAAQRFARGEEFDGVNFVAAS